MSNSEKSQTEMELEAVNAAILEVMKNGVSEYQIYNRKAVYHDLTELKKIQSRLRNRIARIKRKSGMIARGIRFQ